MRLQALIFDVDGTLAETEEAHRVAFNRAFADAGLPWIWDRPLYGRLLKTTGGKERIAEFAATLVDGGGGALPANLSIAKLHAAKTAIYAQLVASGSVALRPGIHQLLEAAHAAGMRLAIATTTSRPNVDALLNATLAGPLRNEFEIMICGDEVPRKKPAPDVYLAALAGLGLPAAACLAIEDSSNGLRSARAAGLTTVVTKSVYTAAEVFPVAAIVTSCLTELAARNAGPDRSAGSVLLAALVELHGRSGR